MRACGIGMNTRNRARTSRASFVGSEEQREAAAFACALHPREPELQAQPPAANAFPGALDVLLMRGVLLVVRCCCERGGTPRSLIRNTGV